MEVDDYVLSGRKRKSPNSPETCFVVNDGKMYEQVLNFGENVWEFGALQRNLKNACICNDNTLGRLPSRQPQPSLKCHRFGGEPLSRLRCEEKFHHDGRRKTKKAREKPYCFVKTLSGSKVRVDLDDVVGAPSNDVKIEHQAEHDKGCRLKVKHVKQRLEEMLSIPMGDFRLLYNDSLIRDEEYEVSPGSLLCMFLQFGSEGNPDQSKAISL